ncbi:hypothetical protein CONLIGDRAFT_467738 [Coniochaeta ligniaria NRRL 30616]|uniref:Uncharacterized protein n=1 Tax=Coniochaeta ligniaria NRRL 30616 TaxID=1408157 RepID=A0A1J7IG46_9PEZI|nr:hypothetical protein CONLIGDRAFT_467738 [Coniochaeta ligniaria NRRL 30616]
MSFGRGVGNWEHSSGDRDFWKKQMMVPLSCELDYHPAKEGGGDRLLGPSHHVEAKFAKGEASLFKPTGSCPYGHLPQPVPSHSVKGRAGARKTSYHSILAPSPNIQMSSFLSAGASESKIQIAFLKSGQRQTSPTSSRLFLLLLPPHLSSSFPLPLLFSTPPLLSFTLICAAVSHGVPSPVILLLLWLLQSVRPPLQCSCAVLVPQIRLSPDSLPQS